MVKKKRKKTRTSSFGVTKRESHDSSTFYSRKLYQKNGEKSIIEYRENKLPTKYKNKIIQKSSQLMEEIPDESIHLMISSPPYNTGKDYDK